MKDYTAIAKKMIEAPSCCAELKEAAGNYIAAAGTDKEAEAAKMLIAEAEEDIMPIDMLIGFCGTPKAAEIFGAERAAAILQHGKDIKAKGAAYCDCPACAACEELINNK